MDTTIDIAEFRNTTYGIVPHNKGLRSHRTPPTEIIPPVCIYCKGLCSTHSRCTDCEILLHTELFLCHCGKAHTYTKNGTECIKCVNYKENGMSIYPDGFFDGLAATLGF